MQWRMSQSKPYNIHRREFEPQSLVLQEEAKFYHNLPILLSLAITYPTLVTSDKKRVLTIFLLKFLIEVNLII